MLENLGNWHPAIDIHIKPLLQVQRVPVLNFYSRFIWANGRAAGIGRTIPVHSIGRLPLLEALPSLPLDI